MDLWQFYCYIDGYNARCSREDMDRLVLACRIALYSSGSAFSKKKPPDATKELNEIKEEMYNFLSGRSNDKEEKIVNPEEEIELLKKQMKYFN